MSLAPSPPQLTTCPEFGMLTEVFRPVVHVIMLVWKHSKHYNTPARLVVLMREICNDLIDQARPATLGAPPPCAPPPP